MNIMEKCPFCNPVAGDILVENNLCYAIWDRFPVNKGHLLIIPFRHTPDFFSLTPDEMEAVLALVHECRGVVEEKFSPDGYNIGFNIGIAAGQTVLHCHCHMIPRFVGDVVNPRGGVRRVVPGREGY